MFGGEVYVLCIMCRQDDVFLSTCTEGDVIPVDGCGVDTAEVEMRPAKRLKAKGLTLIDFFERKK